MASCGKTTRENNTYFVNSGYPGQFDGTGSCQLTIIKNQPDVCQIRYLSVLFYFMLILFPYLYNCWITVIHRLLN